MDYLSTEIIFPSSSLLTFPFDPLPYTITVSLSSTGHHTMDYSTLLPEIQHTLSTLYKSECDSRGLDASNALIVPDMLIPVEYPIHIDAGITPVIRVSVPWVIWCMTDNASARVVRGIEKAIQYAHGRGRITLKTDVLPHPMQYVESIRALRAAAGPTHTLPPTHFRVRYSIIVEEVSTGTTLTRDGVRKDDLHAAQKELERSITESLYSQEQVALALDMQAAHAQREHDSMRAVQSIALAVPTDTITHVTVQYSTGEQNVPTQ